MACHRPGDKPLSEPTMVSLLTHIYICVTRPHWVNNKFDRKCEMMYQFESDNTSISLLTQVIVSYSHWRITRIHSWKKRLLHYWMRYPFGDYSYSICLWGLRAGWLAGFMFFYVFVCTILRILVNLWHLLILKKIAAWAYINVIGMVIVVNLANKLDFCIMLLVVVVLCMPCQYRVFPPLAGSAGSVTSVPTPR